MKEKDDLEIELKLRVDDLDIVEERLKALKARLVKKVHQKSLLFNAPFAEFEKRDQTLRLHIETDENGTSQSIFGFKDTAATNELGHRSRPEYETAIDDPEALQKILEAVGFYVSITLEKDRALYKFNGVEVALDQFDFGSFVEIEGTSKDIEKARADLDLSEAEVLTQGYVYLWAQAKGIDLKSLKRD